MRQHLLGEQFHRLFDHGMLHDPALIEVANKLIHPVLATQRLHPLYAIVRIAKHTHFSVEILVPHAFDSGQDLPKGLKALDICLTEGPKPLCGLT